MQKAVVGEQEKPGNTWNEEKPFGSRVLKQTASKQGRVLIVEDEQELVDLLEFNLLRHNFEVLVAADGLEACRIIGREKPDLILLDLLLPLLDGWEICRMVRMNPDPRIAEIPIILLSALGALDDRIKGYDLGADLYLPKPYAIKEVIRQTHQLIERRRSHQELVDRVATLEQWHASQDLWQHALFHELGNQLTIISGMAQHLDERHQLVQDESREYMRHIRHSSAYLGALAENYLMVRQLEKHPEPLTRPCDSFLLFDLIDDLRRLFEPQAKEYGNDLRFQTPASDLHLSLQPLALKIILSALVENALKYAGLGASIRLAVAITADKLLFQVTDNGPGISFADRERVFDKFFRGQGPQPKGTGLGLYMARTLAQAMAGELSLCEQTGPGCTFVLTLPLAP